VIPCYPPARARLRRLFALKATPPSHSRPSRVGCSPPAPARAGRSDNSGALEEQAVHHARVATGGRATSHTAGLRCVPRLHPTLRFLPGGGPWACAAGFRDGCLRGSAFIGRDREPTLALSRAHLPRAGAPHGPPLPRPPARAGSCAC